MKKIKILELDVTALKELFTTNSAGIYQKTMSVPLGVQSASPITTIFGGTWEIGADPIQVGSVRVNNTLLGAVGDVSELYVQDGSFFFDEGTQILYIALFDYDPAWCYNTYKVGETTGFISESQMQLINNKLYPVKSRIGATYYEPRLEGDIEVSESVDDQTNGIFVFEDIKATIINGDGKYDKIRDEVTGNEARVLMAHISDSAEEEAETGIPYKVRAESTDFQVIRQGVVEDIDYSDPNYPVITAIDIRADWTQTIGTTLMTTTDFPDLEDKYVDKLKPILIGQVNGAKCIRLEPKPSSSANTDFLVCDTSIGDITTVDSIYFDGKISGAEVDRELLAGEYSIDLTTGVLTINNYDSGDAYFYGVGKDLHETVSIVLFLLDNYANIAYLSSNFNQVEMLQIQALDYLTHVYITEKGQTLEKTIEKLVSDIKVDFFQQGSVMTMRKSNEERTATEIVPYWQIESNPVPWVNDRTDTIKSISIGYNVDYREDAFDTYYDNSNEEEALENDRKAVDRAEETNLVNRSDVAEIYDEYYSRFSVPSRTITINRLQPFSAMLTDFVVVRVSRYIGTEETQIFERANYKIISIDQNANTAEAVYFSDAPDGITSSSDYSIANYGVNNYG